MANNEKLSVITKGVAPLLHPQEDLNWKKDCNSNSWFAICHFEAAGEIVGTYKGKKCSGFYYIEYVGKLN